MRYLRPDSLSRGVPDGEEAHYPQSPVQGQSRLGGGPRQYTISELAHKYSLHPNVIRGWKKQLVEHLPELFQRPGSNARKEDEAEMVPHLYQQIGRLQMELEWLKKKHESLRG